MIYLDEIKVGDILDCTGTKATVTFIDGDEVHIIWKWGETDIIKEEHFKHWNNTYKTNSVFNKMLKEMETIKSDNGVINITKREMTEIKEAAEILQRWLNIGADGMTEERLGYIEGWFHDEDAKAFKTAIYLLKNIC